MIGFEFIYAARLTSKNKSTVSREKELFLFEQMLNTSLFRSNVFFVVTKLANDFSAGDWTTTVTGLMMVNK